MAFFLFQKVFTIADYISIYSERKKYFKKSVTK